MLIFLLACAPDYTVLSSKDTGATGPNESEPADDSQPSQDDSEELLDETWADATLVVHSPTSGAFIPLGEAATFSATVYDKNGSETDFDDIAWSTDKDSTWGLVGKTAADASLIAGVHTLTAEAELPNGDRLSYAVGGVLVQSPYAGTYSGTIVTNVTYDTYSVGCSGAALVYINMAGEVVSGSTSCLISLQGFELDATYNLDMTNDLGTLGGAINLDLQWFEIPIDSSGTVDEDGNLIITFTTEVDIGTPITVDGTIEAIRISREAPE